MNHQKKFLSFLTIILLSVLFLTACGTGSANTDKGEQKENNDEKIVRIGYQKGNTLNILKESGILEEKLETEGYEVEWREFIHGGKLLEALFTGNIDYGHASDGAGINAQAGNKPLVYVGADQPNPEGVGILVHDDSGIESIEDLKGKSIGATKGGNHHYLAVLAVKAAGLDVDDVEWVHLNDSAQLRTAFETNKIDAYGTYDPFFAGAEYDLETINLTEGKDYDYPNRTFYFANVDFNEAHPELVDLILEATDESDQWANENKPEVVQMVSEALDIKGEIIEIAINRREYAVDLINEEIIAAQQRQADVYYEIGLIPKKVDVSEDMPIK